MNGQTPNPEEIASNIPITNHLFSFRPISRLELQRLVNKLPKFKAPGIDGVNGYVISLAFPEIGDILLDIFNLSLRLGLFPNDWKCAVVRPLHKSGALDNPSNFRPVSLLRLFGKNLERLAFNQLRPYFDKFVAKSQFGFLSGKSTETALLKVCDTIQAGMDKKMLSTLVLLDMSKAFDCVNHSILLAKMNKYGIQGTALNWFRSYLDNRTQIMKIGTQMSPARPVKAGVPQGSILGPLLFLIAINDLPDVVQNCKITLFADDIQLCITYRPEDTQRAYFELESDLQNIEHWCQNNGLKNNREKTQVVTIATAQNRRNIPENVALTINDKQVTFSNKVKNLGIWLDSQLNFLPHLNWISAKCKRDLFALNRVKKCLPRPVLKKTIESTVFPRLFYCSSVIQAAPKSYVEQTSVRVVNFGAKLIFGLRKFDRASESRRNLQWLDAHSEMKKRTQLTAFKTFADMENKLELCHPLILSNTRTSSRLNTVQKLKLPNFRTDVGKRSFSYRAPLLLNEICESLKLDLNKPLSVEKFKLLLKDYYYNCLNM